MVRACPAPGASSRCPSWSPSFWGSALSVCGRQGTSREQVLAWSGTPWNQTLVSRGACVNLLGQKCSLVSGGSPVTLLRSGRGHGEVPCGFGVWLVEGVLDIRVLTCVFRTGLIVAVQYNFVDAGETWLKYGYPGVLGLVLGVGRQGRGGWHLS